MGFLSKFPMACRFNADSDREVLMKGVRDQAGEAAANLGRCPVVLWDAFYPMEME